MAADTGHIPQGSRDIFGTHLTSAETSWPEIRRLPFTRLFDGPARTRTWALRIMRARTGGRVAVVEGS
jgi:hypothetical protein